MAPSPPPAGVRETFQLFRKPRSLPGFFIALNCPKKVGRAVPSEPHSKSNGRLPPSLKLRRTRGERRPCVFLPTGFVASRHSRRRRRKCGDSFAAFSSRRASFQCFFAGRVPPVTPQCETRSRTNGPAATVQRSTKHISNILFSFPCTLLQSTIRLFKERIFLCSGYRLFSSSPALPH